MYIQWCHSPSCKYTHAAKQQGKYSLTGEKVHAPLLGEPKLCLAYSVVLQENVIWLTLRPCPLKQLTGRLHACKYATIQFTHSNHTHDWNYAKNLCSLRANWHGIVTYCLLCLWHMTEKNNAQNSYAMCSQTADILVLYVVALCVVTWPPECI